VAPTVTTPTPSTKKDEDRDSGLVGVNLADRPSEAFRPSEMVLPPSRGISLETKVSPRTGKLAEANRPLAKRAVEIKPDTLVGSEITRIEQRRTAAPRYI
jgi:hypothetical protein